MLAREENLQLPHSFQSLEAFTVALESLLHHLRTVELPPIEVTTTDEIIEQALKRREAGVHARIELFSTALEQCQQIYSQICLFFLQTWPLYNNNQLFF